jgi:hypothetical protein
MKTKSFFIFVVLTVILYSCQKKESALPDPAIEFRIGYLSDSAGVHSVDYKNQDTIYAKDLDTALTITVIEENLLSLDVNSLRLEDIEFTLYLNTTNDNERFDSGKNVYSIGREMGRDNLNRLDLFGNVFVIPVRTSNPILNNNKLEVGQTDFIRISYESGYTGLSKVKTILILKD